ncbi:MAG: hypothetical protein IPJ84_13785 [Bdellovibrionales bacterium]|nr:hypothetical protein [Bdellovibrionales bacterium]
MKLNSVIFHTGSLPAIRNFYENALGLKIGTFDQNGVEKPDCSETYVNYTVGDSEILLCFESTSHEPDRGTIVLTVDLDEVIKRLQRFNVPVQNNMSTDAGFQFLKVKDPEGRSIILER